MLVSQNTPAHREMHPQVGTPPKKSHNALDSRRAVSLDPSADEAQRASGTPANSPTATRCVATGISQYRVRPPPRLEESLAIAWFCFSGTGRAHTASTHRAERVFPDYVGATDSAPADIHHTSSAASTSTAYLVYASRASSLGVVARPPK